VRKIDGVKNVRNLLQVVSSKREAAVNKDDKAIKEAAEAALSAAGGLNGIKVQSVNAGVLLLSGKADDLGDQVRAVRVTYAVSGVRRVASEMTGADQPFMDNVGEKMEPAGKSKSTTKRRMSDGWLTTEVKLHLLGDEKVPSLDINVDSREGVVTLFGTVPTLSAKTAAVREAAKVEGVQRVVNDLQVVPTSRKELVKAEDRDIREDVKRAFEAREELHDVDVAVKGGVVRLTGHVPSRTQQLEAILVSRSTSGVRGVSSDLTIKHKKD
jgi:hyperosmotically inducible protein